MSGTVAQIVASQAAEYSRANVIMIYRPEESTFLNCIHPAGSLFECPTSSTQAKKEHENFQKVLESYGITVYEIN